MRGVLALAAAATIALSSPAVSAPLPRVFDAAWMGFDTGRFPDPTPSGFGPTAMATGDLDGDGITDVVVGQGYFAGPGVSVLPGLGRGTYGRPAYFALPANDSVGRVALFDMDADGDLDVVATIPNAWDTGTEVALWRNDGAGGLTGPQRFAVGDDPVGLATGDLTGDGRPDVVAACGPPGAVYLLEHDGGTGAAAGFLPARPVTVGGTPRFVRVGELDGDGRLDMVVSRGDVFGPMVTVLLADGAGGFTAAHEYRTDNFGPAALALGDMDADGDLDLVLGGQLDLGRDAVRILGNDGSGAFGSSAWNATTGAPHVTDIALADLNADGRLDVVGVAPSGRSSECWAAVLSDGSGGYQQGRIYPTSQYSEAIAAFDADGDGDADVATLARFSSALDVFTNPGSGVFPVPPRHPVDGTPRGIDRADIDADGDLDVVTAAATMQVHRNLGDGRFAPPEPVPNPAGMTTIEGVRLRDMDGDGAPDLLMSPGGNGNFAVAQNRGDGTFQAARQWPSDSCGGGAIDAFDLDLDRDLDVVMADCADGFATYMLIAANDGSAAFVNRPHVPMSLTGNVVESADVDGDDVPDLVVNETGMGIATFHGNGNLTFGPERFSPGPEPLLFTLGDFDGDGVTDAGVVTGQGSAGTDMAGVALGLGNGTFASPILQSGSSTLEPLKLTTDVDAGDADCDGVLDLVVTYYASNDLGVFLGSGDGTLRPQVRYGAAMVPGVTTLGDFDGDGHIDVATVGQPAEPCCGYALLVMRGTCTCIGSPAPDPPGEPTRLLLSRNGTALGFTWTPGLPAAASFRVVRGTLGTWYDHRADDTLGAGACATSVPAFTDPDDAAWDGRNWYYLVLGVGGCSDLRSGAGNAWNGHVDIPRPGPIPTASCP